MILRSLILFVIAGLCGIGGGYLIWLWLREGRGIEYAALGAIILVVWDHPDIADLKFREGICSVWRNFHSSCTALELADRSCSTGPV